MNGTREWHYGGSFMRDTAPNYVIARLECGRGGGDRYSCDETLDERYRRSKGDTDAQRVMQTPEERYKR